MGLWSQELINRGFDLRAKEFSGISYPWELFNPGGSTSNKILLLPGGYNENGVSYQRIIKNSTDNWYGISQKVNVYDTVGGEFYIYIKSETGTSEAYLLLCDTLSDEIIYSSRINGIDTVWRKYIVETPPIVTSNNVKLVICLADKGTIDIDESSFMPKNNVNGVRAEFFKLFKEWQPGIIRYPGGWFADSKLCYLDAAIGDIDKRQSPIEVNPFMSQRMDFGLDEFLLFCDSINAAPHLVVNLENGTPEQAVNWVEYCNSEDTSSKYVSLRIANGREKPYEVKLWEIGNEQWNYTATMPHKYLGHYRAMKKIDNSIETMISGNIWGGEEYLDSLYSVVGTNCDYYSYHSIYPGRPSVQDYDDVERFKSALATSFFPDIEVSGMTKWLQKWMTDENIKLSLTELFLNYNIPWNIIDTLDISASLETGIWMAAYLNSCLRNSKYLHIVEKTFGIGHIKGVYNNVGERIIYPTPFHTVLSYFNNHRGEENVPVFVESEIYNTTDIPGMFMVYDIPYLDAALSKKDSTLYLSIVNRHPNDSILTMLALPLNPYFYDMKVHELYSSTYSEANTVNNPYKLNYTIREQAYATEYSFPPHSHTILEITPANRIIPNDTIYHVNSNILLYPNPAEDELVIILPKMYDEEKELRIYNITGKEIQKNILPANLLKYKVIVSTLPKGVYNLRISTARSQIFSSRFVKL